MKLFFFYEQLYRRKYIIFALSWWTDSNVDLWVPKQKIKTFISIFYFYFRNHRCILNPSYCAGRFGNISSCYFPYCAGSHSWAIWLQFLKLWVQGRVVIAWRHLILQLTFQPCMNMTLGSASYLLKTCSVLARLIWTEWDTLNTCKYIWFNKKISLSCINLNENIFYMFDSNFNLSLS